MQQKFLRFLAVALVSSSAFAQVPAATCEVLISVLPGGNLEEMRKGAPKINQKSCDEWLKGEVEFGQKGEYPNAPTAWLGSGTIKWSAGFFGRHLGVYTSKSSGRQFNYSGKVEKNTSEEFLFTGRDNSIGVDAKFHIKRNSAGEITYALYEFSSQVSGVFRIGKE